MYGEHESCLQVLVVNLIEKNHLEGSSFNGMITLILISWKWDGKYGLDLSGSE